MRLQKGLIPLIFLSLLIFLLSCKNENREQNEIEMQETARDTLNTTTDTARVAVRTFTGDISPINSELNGDSEVSGKVELRVEGDLMRIAVTAEGLAPDMMHMQHLQTSETAGNTQCPGSNADANNDGIIDVTEVSPSAQGIYMIPLHMGPSSLELKVDTYPRTNVNGELQFTRTVSLDSLRQAVGEEYGMQDIDFTRFNYVIQGVSQQANIPQTAQTVSGVEMNQSIPIGCARLEE